VAGSPVKVKARLRGRRVSDHTSSRTGTGIVAAWVDDLTVFGDTPAVEVPRSNTFARKIADVDNGGFHVKDYGMPTSILGTEIRRRRDRANKTSKLTQSLFVRTLAQRLNIPSTAPDTPFPTGTTGSLPEYDPNLPAGDTSELRSLIGRANRDLNSRPPAGPRGHGAHAVAPWPPGPCRPPRAPAGSGSVRRTPRPDLARPGRTRAPLPVAVIRLGGVGIVPLTGGRLRLAARRTQGPLKPSPAQSHDNVT
jgi:hypothetical protein